MRTAILYMLVIAATLALAPSAQAHESPIDHVERDMVMWVKDGRLYLRYRVQVTERLALMQLAEADTNHDGTVSDAEFENYFALRSHILSVLLHLELNGKEVAWEPVGKVTLDPRLRQTYLFSAPLGDPAAGPIDGRLDDEFSRRYPGYYRYLQSAPVPEGAILVPCTLDPQVEMMDGNHPGMLLLQFSIKPPAATGR